MKSKVAEDSSASLTENAGSSSTLRSFKSALLIKTSIFFRWVGGLLYKSSSPKKNTFLSNSILHAATQAGGKKPTITDKHFTLSQSHSYVGLEVKTWRT